MTTLLLRLAAPHQSWGGGTRFVKELGTERTPTRSALIGLAACALGEPRGQWSPWLHELTLLARIDQPGCIETDFHTVSAPNDTVAKLRSREAFLDGRRDARGGWVDVGWTIPKADDTKWSASGSTTATTRRDYLADAEFIVAIHHSDPAHVNALADAFTTPAFMTYLGRKPFAPSFPFVLGTTPNTPHDALAALPTLSPAPTPVAVLTGDRNTPTTALTPPIANDRTDFLTWAAAHLDRP